MLSRARHHVCSAAITTASLTDRAILNLWVELSASRFITEVIATTNSTSHLIVCSIQNSFAIPHHNSGIIEVFPNTLSMGGPQHGSLARTASTHRRYEDPTEPQNTHVMFDDDGDEVCVVLIEHVYATTASASHLMCHFT